jgi:hypothetical protein
MGRTDYNCDDKGSDDDPSGEFTSVDPSAEGSVRAPTRYPIRKVTGTHQKVWCGGCEGPFIAQEALQSY